MAFKHGHAIRGGRTDEYNIWANMLDRCTNHKRKGYKHYGGRGIVICDRWKVFANFLADMGNRPNRLHQLDRINNDGNYEPDNCRWATHQQQCWNMRTTVMLTMKGVTKARGEWAKEYGISPQTLAVRLKQGASPEEAITRPRFNRLHLHKKEYDKMRKMKTLGIILLSLAAISCVTPYKEPSGKYIKTAQTEMRSMFGTNQSFARLERCNGPEGWTLFFTEGDFTNCVLLTKADQDEWLHAYSRGSGPEIVGAAIMGGAIGAGAAVSGVNAAAGATANASNTAIQTVGKHGRR